MARKKKHSLDAEIIDLLMTSDDAKTATEIAKALGLSKAKDVNSRLITLNKKGIITKSKYNKQVYWSCESELCNNVTIGGENVYASAKSGLENLTSNDKGSAQPESSSTYIASPSSEYTDKTLEIIYSTI